MADEHSLPNGRKPTGRPHDPGLTYLRQLLPLRSERTVARLKSAIDRMHLLGFTPEQVTQAMTEATRANGSLNVRVLDRYTEYLMREIEKGGR